jgi:hypothetical protein
MTGTIRRRAASSIAHLVAASSRVVVISPCAVVRPFTPTTARSAVSPLSRPPVRSVSASVRQARGEPVRSASGSSPGPTLAGALASARGTLELRVPQRSTKDGVAGELAGAVRLVRPRSASPGPRVTVAP